MSDHSPLSNRKFHFISGLPRSGSRLLSGILLQNPRFHAGMTSPVGSLCNAVLGKGSAGSNLGPVIGTDKRLYSRLEGLAQHDQSVGFAWSALREAFHGEHASSLLLIDCELLTRAPARVMAPVYDFLGEPHFEHDFDNVEYDAEEFDIRLGAPGLHKVKAQVTFTPRPSVIPLFDKFDKMSLWNDKAGSAANVITVQHIQQGKLA